MGRAGTIVITADGHAAVHGRVCGKTMLKEGAQVRAVVPDRTAMLAREQGARVLRIEVIAPSIKELRCGKRPSNEENAP